MKDRFILSIDQGTSSSKVIIVDEKGNIISKASIPIKSSFPQIGYVEQDPLEIYDSVIKAVRTAVKSFSQNHDPCRIEAIGISNQRETFMLWDDFGFRTPAIVWQCKRSIEICERLKREGLEEIIRKKTGLTIDPYFSGTKLLHYTENNPQVLDRSDKSKLRFGTIDTWLLYCLTKGKSFMTDSTNASRTLLYNIYEHKWDSALLKIFKAENLLMATIKHSADSFGFSDCDGIIPNKIPIMSMIGDSHAAAFGEGCVREGIAKATMGTGSSIMMNTGDHATSSNDGIMNTICFDYPSISYAREGIIVSCGATLRWIKDNIGLFTSYEEMDKLASSVDGSDGVSLLPAFSGMGAPYWKMHAKAAIMGMTFTTTKAHILRAALESIAFQVSDILRIMGKIDILKLDGGLTNNRMVMQLIADLTGITVHTIGDPDVSALGAAFLAGLATGLYDSLETVEGFYKPAFIYTPQPLSDTLLSSYSTWRNLMNLL